MIFIDWKNLRMPSSNICRKWSTMEAEERTKSPHAQHSAHRHLRERETAESCTKEGFGKLTFPEISFS